MISDGIRGLGWRRFARASPSGGREHRRAEGREHLRRGEAGEVLGIVWRVIAGHLVKKAGETLETATPGSAYA